MSLGVLALYLRFDFADELADHDGDGLGLQAQQPRPVEAALIKRAG